MASERTNEFRLGGHSTPGAHTPPQWGHGLGMRTDPGSNSKAHGAACTYINAQTHVGTLKVHHAGGAKDGHLATMLKKQIALGRPGKGATYLNKGSRLAAVTIDNHPAAHEDISNNDTGAQDRNCETNVTKNDTTEARAISIRTYVKSEGSAVFTGWAWTSPRTSWSTS